uniref:Uncharacterized protein n=1 Tax=Anguilla anguilla TaxID=7936 RepID=A0A0E9RDA7_ANGAN
MIWACDPKGCGSVSQVVTDVVLGSS